MLPLAVAFPVATSSISELRGVWYSRVWDRNPPGIVLSLRRERDCDLAVGA